MVNDKIDDTIFLIILQLHKNHNRADVYSIHKQIIKLLILKILPVFLNDVIHTLTTDRKNNKQNKS